MVNPKKTKPAADKDKKPKLVRDSFTIPKDEYSALDTFKERALKAGIAIKKSELLRAGLLALGKMSDAEFKHMLLAVPTLKTGRPTQTASEKPAQPVSKPATFPVPAGKKTAVQAKVATPKPATKPVAKAPAKTPVKAAVKPAVKAAAAPAPAKTAVSKAAPVKTPAKKAATT